MNSAIGSVAQLVEVIQSQLATRSAQNGAAGLRSSKLSSKTRASSEYADENLPKLIALRVRQIGRDDPQRGRKAFRVFLEAVLLAHFGEGLIKDPRFFQMVDDVQSAMETDQQCNALVARAIEQLLTEKTN